ncbi:MAG: hypothetical protein QOF89_5067, partial [Acidobacteriota bacterium]|nr:hypothetical protein [Acidobacteriota bacterium]
MSAREPWTRALLETGLVAALVASPLLRAPWSALSVAGLSLVWLWRLGSRERRIAGPLLGLAVAALLTGWALGWSGRTSQAEWVRETRRDYHRLWTGLQGEAAAAARVVGPPPEKQDPLPPQYRLEAFRRLADVEVGEGQGRRALLLLDPDGVPVAWAGEGLLHELSQELPRSGSYYRASFSAVTLLAIHPLDASRRPWRIAAGASYAADALPFRSARTARWSLADAPAQALPGTDAVTLANAPTLVVERGAGGGRSRLIALTDRLAWIALGLALLALAVVRGLRRVLPGGPHLAEEPAGRLVLPLVLGGLIALAASFPVPLGPLGVLLAGLGLAAVGLRPPKAL